MRYLKQALAMMREEKLFSSIYILGTALAIAFTMVMAVVYYAKLADIAPEVNRSRTVYLWRNVSHLHVIHFSNEHHEGHGQCRACDVHR